MPAPRRRSVTREGDALPYDTSNALRDRIETLFGRPLHELERHVEEAPTTTLLGALLGIHADLVFAERNIDFQLDRLRQFTGDDREVGRFAAGHILDCAQRLSQAVTARDAHTKALTAALQGLRRSESPATTVTIPAARTAPAPRTH